MAGTVFSTTLQRLRKERSVTQEQLASHLGVSAQAVSKWENGSYPEGDLIPKIAEFFDVSISYLYGQEKEAVSVEQSVMDVIGDIMLSTDVRNKSVFATTHKEVFNKMFDIIWAMQIGPWSGNRTYYNRTEYDNQPRTGSVITDDAGFAFMGLNKNASVYAIAKEPEEGFAAAMPDVENTRRFLKALSEDGALEVLLYMLSLKDNEFVSAKTIAANAGINESRIKEILSGIDDEDNYNCCFPNVFVVNSKNEREKLYGIRSYVTGTYLPILMLINTILNPMEGYQMQIAMREKPWIEKKTEKEGKKKNV